MCDKRAKSKRKYHRFKNLTQRDFNLVRKIHISLLATPNERVLRPWPDPKLEQTLPAPVSAAAMRAKPSDRTIMLFKSRKFIGKKYQRPAKPQHYVSPAALKAVPTSRTKKLALPVKRAKKLKKAPSKKELARRKKKIKLYKKNRPEWLKMRAGPKKVHAAPPMPPRKLSFPYQKGPPLSLYERMERIKILARPTRMKPKKQKKKPKIHKLKEVTDRVRELSLPKRIPSETLRNLKFEPGKIKRSALKAVASERTKQLATPHIRSKAVDNDLREDAFTIPPAALTYKASQRIVELAKPKAHY